MRKVSLTVYDRAMLKIAAQQTKGSIESMRKYIRADDVLQLGKIPDSLKDCSKVEPKEYLLEDAEFEYVKTMFTDIKEWPLTMAIDIIATTERLDAAQIAPKKGAVSIVDKD